MKCWKTTEVDIGHNRIANNGYGAGQRLPTPVQLKAQAVLGSKRGGTAGGAIGADLEGDQLFDEKRVIDQERTGRHYRIRTWVRAIALQFAAVTSSRQELKAAPKPSSALASTAS